MTMLSTLDDCLWHALQSGRACARDPKMIWATTEGVRRIDRDHVDWRPTHANKQHKCARGCEITPGDLYFRYGRGPDWGLHLKVCVGCVAMLLYFLRVADLPPYCDTHWDLEEGGPFSPGRPIVRVNSPSDLHLDGVMRLLSKVAEGAKPKRSLKGRPKA